MRPLLLFFAPFVVWAFTLNRFGKRQSFASPAAQLVALLLGAATSALLYLWWDVAKPMENSGPNWRWLGWALGGLWLGGSAVILATTQAILTILREPGSRARRPVAVAVGIMLMSALIFSAYKWIDATFPEKVPWNPVAIFTTTEELSVEDLRYTNIAVEGALWDRYEEIQWIGIGSCAVVPQGPHTVRLVFTTGEKRNRYSEGVLQRLKEVTAQSLSKRTSGGATLPAPKTRWNEGDALFVQLREACAQSQGNATDLKWDRDKQKLFVVQDPSESLMWIVENAFAIDLRSVDPDSIQAVANGGNAIRYTYDSSARAFYSRKYFSAKDAASTKAAIGAFRQLVIWVRDNKP
jgi:hypothetical protein